MVQDALGYILSVGDKVVYNLSGELAIGEIIDIVEKWDITRYTSTKYFSGYVLIKHAKGISKVRNPRSIVCYTVL